MSKQDLVDAIIIELMLDLANRLGIIGLEISFPDQEIDNEVKID